MILLDRCLLTNKYGSNLKELKKIRISKSNIGYIVSNAFVGLVKLEKLSLYENKIEELDAKLFEYLLNLKKLYLYKNKLKSINSNTFKNLSNLEILSLYENEIEQIDVLENLSSLKELDLAYNKLKKIDSKTFNGLAELEILSLDNNEIKEIDLGSFKSLSSLKELDLGDNKLKKIDSNAFKGLTGLEILSLDNNKIEGIDVNSFKSLSNLKRLKLSYNKLRKIDRECFEPLKSIVTIDLHENHFLNALSFSKSFDSVLNEYGFLLNWCEFLQQFSQFEYDDVSNRSEFMQQFSEYGQRKQERRSFDSIEREYHLMDDDNISESSSSSRRSIQSIKDPYIGEVFMYRYKILRKLGKGQNGCVYFVDDKNIQNKRIKQKAVKIIDRLDSESEKELDMLVEINHENIVRYFDHFYLKIGDDNQTCLITEFCKNGDLKNKIEETKHMNIKFSENQILEWMIQATQALNYLHSKRIIHRDIKPANMLLNGENIIKLGDLGFSKQMDKSHVCTFLGTLAYMSPEVHKRKYYLNTDVWSLGCVLYELIFLELAFPRRQYEDEDSYTDRYTDIWSRPYSNFCHSGLFSPILPKMLEKDNLKRISSQGLLFKLVELENGSDSFI